MSLLLDALKKAAEAKNRQPLDGVDPEEAGLIPLEDSNVTGSALREPAKAEAFVATAEVPPPVAVPEPDASEDSTKPDAPEAPKSAVSDPIPDPITPVPAAPPVARIRREAPSTPPPSKGTPPDTLYDEFDETQQLNTDELRAELLGSGSYGSRDHARAVFSSKEVRKPLRQRPSVLVLLLVVLLLILAAGWVYYGYGERDFKLQRELAGIRSRAPITTASQSVDPQVNQQQPGSTSVPSRPIENAAQRRVEPVEAAVSEQRSAASLPEDSVKAPSSPEVKQGNEIPQRASAKLTGDAGTSSPQRSATQPVTPVKRAEPKQQTAARTEEQSRAQLPTANLSIARRAQTAPIDVLLQRGYRAYQGGNTDDARVAYFEALQIDPRNRDALLGAAAVAFVEGDTALAVGLYQRLLAQDPRDPAAVIGLQALGKQADPTRLESELRNLLQQSPDSAPLHFALGGVYSRQQRWAEAQKSYFNAYSVAPGNPDYLYNLAVSLDNLGKRSAAAGFYRQALQAARGQISSFDQAAALNRLNQLDEGAQ